MFDECTNLTNIIYYSYFLIFKQCNKNQSDNNSENRIYSENFGNKTGIAVSIFNVRDCLHLW